MSEGLARLLRTAGIRDPAVLAAIARVPRAAFVPPEAVEEAERDRPLPIGAGQTISQPFVVAYMTEQLALAGQEQVLEVGTGSGYQAAVLALLAREVFSIELIPELAHRAAAVLQERLGLANLRLRVGDGAQGWPEAAPFDRIIVTAATPEVPAALRAQLAPGGRLLLPLGDPGGDQVLHLVERRGQGETVETDLLPVRFVPLVHHSDEGGPTGLAADGDADGRW
ncbi:MAG: protein-L-isoaspartate(D-aspartate) O-methyltransferase [Anaeromyxobacter sp.]